MTTMGAHHKRITVPNDLIHLIRMKHSWSTLSPLPVYSKGKKVRSLVETTDQYFRRRQLI